MSDAAYLNGASAVSETGELPPGSDVSETDELKDDGLKDDGQTMLSLKQLHAALAARGVKVSYSSLSELIAEGDIARQLRAGGQGNRREFLPETVDVLAGFLAVFQETGAKRPKAPYLLSRFLEAGETTELTASPGSLFSETPKLTADAGRSAFGFLAPLATLPAVLQSLADAIRNLAGSRPPAAPPMPDRLLQDRLLTAEEAGALLACSPRAVSRYVPPVLPRKWRESDVLRYIAGLEASK